MANTTVQETDLDSMIVDTEATITTEGKVRLKFLAIAGGCGPELIMERSMAQTVIEKLTAALAT
jgi:hypothetical protein